LSRSQCLKNSSQKYPSHRRVTRISAVLIGNTTSASSVASNLPELWINRSATNPPEGLEPFATVAIDRSGNLVTTDVNPHSSRGVPTSPRVAQRLVKRGRAARTALRCGVDANSHANW
jgi:hypothetical protein